MRDCHAQDRIVGVQDKITVFYRVENKEQVSSNRRLHMYNDAIDSLYKELHRVLRNTFYGIHNLIEVSGA